MEQTLQQQKDKGLRLNQSLGQYFKNEKGETYKNIYIYIIIIKSYSYI